MARQQALPSIENYREKKINRLKKIIGLNRTSNRKDHRLKKNIKLGKMSDQEDDRVRQDIRKEKEDKERLWQKNLTFQIL